MKAYDLQPTRENIIATLQNDLLDRNKDVFRFVSLLGNIEDSCSIALDGKWGSGKTFFVQQVKLIIEACNSFIGTPESSDCELVRQYVNRYYPGGAEKLFPLPQVPVYYDAWANDNDVDPILSIVYQIAQCASANFYADIGKQHSLLDTAAAIAETITGKNVTALAKLSEEQDPLSVIKTQKSVQSLVDDFLSSLLPEQGNRLVVFIDELDRCQPNYAVRLLERIKHYFSNDLITFVFSVNTNQLQHTIKGHYGNGFDASRYLNRFFDLYISLPPADLTKYYSKLGFDNRGYVYESVCKEVINAFHFELREIAKFYRMAKIAAYKPTHSNRYDFSFSDEKAIQFCLMYIVPISIGLRISSQEQFTAFIEGKDSSPLINIVGSGEIGRHLCSELFSANETYDGPASADGREKLSHKLTEVYHALFAEDYTYARSQCIGSYSFSPDTRAKLMEVLSLLSNYAIYDA